MKIAVISHSAVVDVYREKFHALAQLGCEIHLLLPPSWPEGNRWVKAPAAHEENGIWIHVLKAGGIGKVGGLHLYGLERCLKKICPDLLHVEEEPYSLVCGQSVRAAIKLGIPLVFFTWENILRSYKLPLRWIDGWVLKRTAFAIAGNQEAKQVLVQRGFRGTCWVLPQYGFNPKDFPARITDQPNPVFTIGYFGRLMEEKGIATLLHAVAQFKFEFKLIIMGSGPYAATIEHMIQHSGLETRVEMRPPVTNREVGKALRTLDVLVLPSETRPDWKEQFGRILVEAMASEVAVIGSDSGEIPHVIGEAGMVFPEGQVNALLYYLEQLQADPKARRQTAKKGRVRVLERFTTLSIAKQTLEIYRACQAGSWR